MAISRTLVIIILALVGFLIMFIIVYMFYSGTFNEYKNLSIRSPQGIEDLIKSALPFIFLKRKRSDALSTLILLIIALVIIVAMVFVYYKVYLSANTSKSNIFSGIKEIKNETGIR